MNGDSAAFAKCLAFTLEREGIDSNDPLDPGKRTRFGIAQRYHPHVNISTLTREGAIAIYRAEYWDACNCDALPLPIALCVFDAAVNPGEGGARVDLQRAVGVRADGLIGERTVAAVQQCEPRQLITYLCGLRLRRYMLVPSRERRERFGLGWALRVLECQNLALSWVA
jgi:lysozyme family protein